MAFDLGAALKDVSKLGTNREQIEYIRLDLIDEDPNNFYQLSDIDQLAANIELCGLQQPIRVRPIPETDRYMIVSGHRRRKAIEMLAKDDPEKWREVSCIIERDEASPALQQLRLIFANSNTRKMSDAEISEQAVQVEKLLYQLKEEEGYEFPGRMRDHVAEIVGASKSKLARLKVIREKLVKCFQSEFKKGKLNESVAYALSQLPEEDQNRLFDALKINGRSAGWYDAADIKSYKERCGSIDRVKCERRGRKTACQNGDNKKMMAACTPRWAAFHCTKCCSGCPDLISCKNACPVMAEKVAKLKADKREARKQEREAQAEKERPAIEKISALWQRFGLAREQAFKEFDDCKRALGIGYFAYDAEKVMKLECGEAKVTPETKLPYDYNCYLSSADRLIALADLFGCSIDYLLCRTDVKEMATEVVPESDREEKDPAYIMGAWYPASVEPPVGVRLILMDSMGYVDTGKYKGCGEYTMDYGDPVVLWTLEPKEKDAAQTPPPAAGWQSGTPEAYGTYAAYVKVTGAANPMLRELLWDGEEWLMFGEKINQDVTVQCWADRPDI